MTIIWAPTIESLWEEERSALKKARPRIQPEESPPTEETRVMWAHMATDHMMSGIGKVDDVPGFIEANRKGIEERVAGFIGEATKPITIEVHSRESYRKRCSELGDDYPPNAEMAYSMRLRTVLIQDKIHRGDREGMGEDFLRWCLFDLTALAGLLDARWQDVSEHSMTWTRTIMAYMNSQLIERRNLPAALSRAREIWTKPARREAYQALLGLIDVEGPQAVIRMTPSYQSTGEIVGNKEKLIIYGRLK